MDLVSKQQGVFITLIGYLGIVEIVYSAMIFLRGVMSVYKIIIINN